MFEDPRRRFGLLMGCVSRPVQLAVPVVPRAGSNVGLSWPQRKSDKMPLEELIRGAMRPLNAVSCFFCGVQYFAHGGAVGSAYPGHPLLVEDCSVVGLVPLG